MGRTLLRILKIICYVALGALLAGFAALAFLGVLDVCPRLDEGAISCVSPVFEVIASIAMASAICAPLGMAFRFAAPANSGVSHGTRTGAVATVSPSRANSTGSN